MYKIIKLICICKLTSTCMYIYICTNHSLFTALTLQGFECLLSLIFEQTG